MDTFQGYVRADGSVGVRNHVAVVPSVACANGVVSAIAGAVPEVVPLLHAHGCGRGGADMEGHALALQNICRNPNLGAVLVVGLGCEMVSAEGMAMAAASAGKPVERVMIQESGGSQKAAARGIDLARRLVQEAAPKKREPAPMDKLVVGLECGGSDAFSGVTANPGVGAAADRLVARGATVILTETTEMIGTSHILERRAVNPEVAAQIAEMISAQERITQEVLGPLAKVAISPGNMDGGMSSIREKSLGCIVKGGTTPIQQVVDYGVPPTEHGLVLMQGPGYDTDSLTGLAAAGAQVILFTTGRGNPIGHPVAPVIKIASNSRLYKNMTDDMDVNAGVILEGRTIDDTGREIHDLVGRVCSGEATKAERNGQNGILCIFARTTSL